MVTGTNADVLFIKNLADVVGVNIAEGKAQNRAANLNIARAMNHDLIAVPSAQSAQCVFGELHFVLANISHADVAQIINGSAQTNHFNDRRSASFKL